MPCNSESADGAAASTADGTARRIRCKRISLANFRQQLVYEETGIGVAQRVVLGGPIVRILCAQLIRIGVATLPWRDEDTDGHGNVFLADQIVEHLRNAQLAL